MLLPSRPIQKGVETQRRIVSQVVYHPRVIYKKTHLPISVFLGTEDLSRHPHLFIEVTRLDSWKEEFRGVLTVVFPEPQLSSFFPFSLRTWSVRWGGVKVEVGLRRGLLLLVTSKKGQVDSRSPIVPISSRPHLPFPVVRLYESRCWGVPVCQWSRTNCSQEVVVTTRLRVYYLDVEEFGLLQELSPVCHVYVVPVLCPRNPSKSYDSYNWLLTYLSNTMFI